MDCPSSRPHRVQRQRTKGSRLPENTLCVDRTTRWGNPFHTHGDGSPMEPALAAHLFEDQLSSAGGYVSARFGLVTVAMIQEHLRGKNLACWCPLSAPCHGDVLLRWASGEEP